MPRRVGRPLACLVLAAAVALQTEVSHAVVAEHRHIHFPVEGPVRFSEDFGAPRSGGRRHEGNDLMGDRLQRLLSAVHGRVSYVRADAGELSGNMLIIVDDDGWSYRYMHINNDSPHTDDNLNPRQWAFAPGIRVGSHVKPGQHVAYLGDSGNAEDTAPHLHFEIRRPDGSPMSPWASLQMAQRLLTDMAPPPPPAPTPPVAKAAAPPKPRPAATRRRKVRRRVEARRSPRKMAKRRPAPRKAVRKAPARRR